MSTDLVKDTRQKVEARIKELRPYVDELAELERVLTALNSGKSRRRTASTKKRSGQKPERKTEFLQVIDENPGITVSDAAKKMGIKPNYLYRIARDLSKGSSPQVKKSGSGYQTVKSETSLTAPKVEESGE